MPISCQGSKPIDKYELLVISLKKTNDLITTIELEGLIECYHSSR